MAIITRRGGALLGAAALAAGALPRGAMAQAPATVDVPAELPCTRVSVRPRWTMPSAKLRL